jgi:hypothetical protein
VLNISDAVDAKDAEVTLPNKFSAVVANEAVPATLPDNDPVNEVAIILPDINVDPDTIRPLRAINSLAIYFFLSFSRMV